MQVYIPLIAQRLFSCCLPQPIQAECVNRGGASLANSTELIGCKGLWEEGSLGAEVNICVCEQSSVPFTVFVCLSLSPSQSWNGNTKGGTGRGSY